MRKSAQELEEEALFLLYVGLLREQRGEKAAAFDEIQNKAAGCMLSILEEKSRRRIFRHSGARKLWFRRIFYHG